MIPSPVIFGLGPSAEMAGRLSHLIQGEAGSFSMRSFPDGETYVRVDSHVSGRPAIVVASLDLPNEKFIPLVLLADTLRDLGARGVGLVAPYLAYMRQDSRFQPGEGITSAYFAQHLCVTFDWLVTVDPHLHRRKTLSDIYSIPTQVLHAAPLLAEWIHREVASAFLLGPDEESRQWVSEVARLAEAPFAVLKKVRHGDRDVIVEIPELAEAKGRIPVLIDDMVSTARTMIEATKGLILKKLPAPVCVVVHPIFAGDAYESLMAAGASRVVSCNTIPHKTNGIDVTKLLADVVSTWV